ncbi:hypothetical protein FA95DRAFT_1593721 [Auriscalpium vulgare]|uniref:Uncharacterized protein n=1 Tax=Auriscalpium vulgare TaxID=40419 RepID=A0ACB8S4G0_9AGAM|nr:hypothetical protein FA95DRAFT_1593721 [Auriscalpium vulgare]
MRTYGPTTCSVVVLGRCDGKMKGAGLRALPPPLVRAADYKSRLTRRSLVQVYPLPDALLLSACFFLSTPVYSMAGSAFVNDYLPQLVGGVFEASVDVPTKGFIHMLRRNIPSVQIREADQCVDASLSLLERFMAGMEAHEQTTVHHEYQHAQKKQEEMRSSNDLHRFFHSHGYRKIAKHAYRTIKVASQRSRERILFQNLLAQQNAPAGVAAGQSSATNFDPTGTSITDPFTDSHLADGSTFGDTVSAISLEVYQSNETQDNIAVVIAETPGEEPTIAFLPLGIEADLPAASP